MKPFRILLATMPAVTMETVAQIIARESEFVIVGALAECCDLTSAVRCSNADLLIVGEVSLVQANVTAVLSSSYPAKIITITENGQCATLNELRTHREMYADISAASLIAAIRSAIGSSDCKPRLQ